MPLFSSEDICAAAGHPGQHQGWAWLAVAFNRAETWPSGWLCPEILAVGVVPGVHWTHLAGREF